ncbi:MAG TPA: ThuA domain-containing protein [Pirellulales bacterium]|nr:ThuA domain-containing protein [Pirellulales bacterium]
MMTSPHSARVTFSRRSLLACLPFVVAAVACFAGQARAADKKIVLVAGTPSHGAGDHEFNAGVLLLKKCLDNVPGIKCDAHLNGWPKDPHAFDGADAIMLYMDGGSGHPLIRDENLAQMRALMAKGVGLVCVHYAVEVPKDRGGPELKDWIGGYYETGYSINPHWVAEIKSLPDHPITRGVKTPFSIRDEWYFNMRFRPDMEGVIPIVSATPPDGVRGTPAAKEHPGREEILAWAVERPDGGRGIGFTGGHFHINWGDDYFRKLILNALVWAAHGDVPADGVPSHVERDELRQNLDPKGKKK